ncbi:MAG: bifunctional pyr operon transcriptional regulator/uracil phosphoribosyltransferase PyrR [Candidatus Delongbacteria bacterium]|jgi:pyrimidine operon attenuation protein/uracil phosphoribosyltransferase|nr:bifunctional pyr operon transcriptional regulator/uracil phosphoribosyltransferase PyrR [Candidatus Delongbacteria bacterium]MDD4204517.1 bifunctional pyr operon transcriptional regulator/uracil phosphoribosyltransferase PyrR [Candidatus Delongbacteria bacterium]MDY0017455.1 bifunctional pyr operon transcriptional regulator/uracil phosphoribosyltransferase PyrR [Candidatus Delongbacteria bacterium]
MPNAKILHTIMDKAQMAKTIKRIASEIVENDNGEFSLVIVGLKTRGEFIARRIYNEIKNAGLSDVEFGVLDATLFRDDFRSNLKVPNFSVNDMPFSVDDKKVVVVDDVIFTGRSVNAAINAIMDIGRPKIIKFAAIIDRGHRELPLAPDFIGEVIKTLPTQEIRVKLSEVDKEDAVYLVEKI